MPMVKMIKAAIGLPLKWHGGKHDLAKWIISLMPPRCRNPNKPANDDSGWLHYVEPYFGGGAVLLANDPEGISEVVNDKNGALINFWAVMQSPRLFAQFYRRVQAVPFSEDGWVRAAFRVTQADPIKPPGYSLGLAVSFFVFCRQSLAGRMKGFTGITKTRTRRGMNNEVSAWLSCIDGLPAVHERLKRVLIVGPSDALDVIRKHDGPRTLFYLDPPYLHETRASAGEYAHEMSDEEHHNLLCIIRQCKGKVMVSGYRSAMYDDLLQNWTRHEKAINNHAAGGKVKRVMTECVWTNF